MSYVPPRSCASTYSSNKSKRRVALDIHRKLTNTIRESSNESIVTNNLGPRRPLQQKKMLPPECYEQEPIHPARNGIAKENAANGYPRILSKSLQGTANPENGPNPRDKLDPKQKCLTQFRAFVRRLILRLPFIFSRGHVRSSDACVYFVR